jgi:hypothetical protein
MIPVKNREVEVERNDENGTVLRVPMRKGWYRRPPLTWVLPLSTYRRVQLDGLGKDVWEACDGRKSVEAIVDDFANRFKLTFHESRLTVTDFLRDLSRRALIALVQYREEGAGREED